MSAPGDRIKRISRRQEERIAEDVGGRRQMASGALPGARGDARKQGEYRIEAKTTEAGKFRLTREILEKIESQAVKQLEQPVVQLEFRSMRLGRPVLTLAITRERPPEGAFIWVKETGKGIVIWPAPMSDLLMKFKAIFFAFVYTQTGQERWYKITDWDSFLRGVGE